MANKKYYWLRLHKDFFKRHDIQIVEGMPNGKDYILFYLKLLVESIDHEGNLRFSDTIPYNDEMLATLTRTNVDVVRSAMKIFTELEMITILNDATIFMEGVHKLIGESSEDDYSRENHRLRQQRYRERQKQLLPETSQLRHDDVIRDVEIEKEIEIEIEKDIDININNINSINAQSQSKKKKKIPEEPSVFSLPLNDGSEYPITQKQIDEWTELYPAVDVMQELRNMKGWCLGNPTKRKTKSGINRFINGWLSREQNKGGGNSGRGNKDSRVQESSEYAYNLNLYG